MKQNLFHQVVVGWLVLLAVGQGAALKLAIDIGHTPKHPGAISARGIGEHQFNRAIAMDLLKAIKADSVLDAFIINPDGQSITLKQRIAIARHKKADLFLSLHHDSAQPQFFSHWIYRGQKRRYCDLFSGYSVFVSRKNKAYTQSRIFGEILSQALHHSGLTPTLHHAQKIKGENRMLLNQKTGLYAFDDLVVLKYTNIPAVLLECGVIANRTEEKKVETRAYRHKLVQSIIYSLKKYASQ